MVELLSLQTKFKRFHMRWISTLSLFILTAFSALAADAGYKIKVKVNGVKDSACYLAYYFGDKQYLKDTAKADKAGNFTFDGKKTLDGGLYLVVLPKKRFFQIIIDKEQNFYVETDTSDLDKLKFKGSEENDLYYNYVVFISGKFKKREELSKEFGKETDKKSEKAESLKKELIKLDKEVKDEWARILKEHPNSFTAKIMIKPQMEPEIPEAPILPNGRKDSTFAYQYYKAHYWDNIDLSDDRILRTPQFHGKLDYFFKNVVIQTPDSIIPEADKMIARVKGNTELSKYVLWYLTYSYEVSNIMGMDAVFVHVVEKYYTKPVVTWLDSTAFYRVTAKAKSMKPLLLGKKAPPLVLVDTMGNYSSLYNVKAKYTVIMFWDPDCGHCQKEVPRLAASYDSIKTLHGEVFGVMGTPEADKWKKFILKHNLKWINVGDPEYHNNFREVYDLKSYPQIYILNENKEIIARKIGTEQVVDFLQRYERMQERKKADEKKKL